MPHSSGGGSSSSGGHSSSSSSHSSSSHSSGGGSLGPSYCVRDHHFNGAKRFVYYRDHRPYYVYSDVDLSRKRNGFWTRYLLLLFYIPFFFVIFAMWFNTIESPVKRLTYTSSYNCIIQDNADVLSASEETELQKVLDDFFETTGVPVAFYTDVNLTWKESYSSLEDYAYDLYCDNFTDEYHWVIIYTQSQEGDADYPSWYWEGMQGNYTDSVLNIFISSFNRKVQNSLDSSETVCKAFENAFTNAVNKFESQTIHIDTTMLFPSIFMTVFISLHCYFMVFHGNKKPKYKNSELVQVDGGADLPKTETCANCGGVYVANKHEKCPHCGAEIKYQSISNAENNLFQ